MNTKNAGPIVIIGSGPAGLGSALALRAVGYDVRIYERYASLKPARNILNLWPPAIKALADIGVDFGRITHRTPAPVRPIRDFMFNHTKFLHEQVGDSNPEQISAQLDLMGADQLHPAVAHG